MREKAIKIINTDWRAALKSQCNGYGQAKHKSTRTWLKLCCVRAIFTALSLLNLLSNFVQLFYGERFNCPRNGVCSIRRKTATIRLHTKQFLFLYLFWFNFVIFFSIRFFRRRCRLLNHSKHEIFVSNCQIVKACVLRVLDVSPSSPSLPSSSSYDYIVVAFLGYKTYK